MILHEKERKISKDIAFECNNRRERMYDGEAGMASSCAALFHNAVSITTVSQSPVPGTYTLIPASEQGNAYRLLNGIIIAFSDNIITINIPGNGIFSIIGSFFIMKNTKENIQQTPSSGSSLQGAFFEMTDAYQLGVKFDTNGRSISFVRIIRPGFLSIAAVQGFNTKMTKYYTIDGAYWVNCGLSVYRFFGINTA